MSAPTSSTSCRSLWWLAVLLTLTVTTPVRAAGPFDTPVDPGLLAGVRGGFAPSDGPLALSFSLQQSVYVNGVLTATSGVQVTQDGTRMSAQGSAPALVQIGTGNSAPVGFGSNGAATAFIQNSLDNQKIRTVTAIDVSAQILGTYRSMNLQSMLNGAISGSLRH